jgi:hypothetical protein
MGQKAISFSTVMMIAQAQLVAMMTTTKVMENKML